MNSENSKRRGRLAAAGALAAACLGASAAAAAASPKVAILGDSITSGYGLAPRQALPARLQAELVRLGAPVQILPLGVAGDTTAGGAARVDRVPPGAAVCVVALGGNDLLQGVDPARVESNLERIVRKLKARGVTVVLAGIRVPPVLQGDYAAAFNQAFARVAERQGVLFVPDMLQGVILNPSLNQPDGVHPNAAGVDVIARRLAPVVARGLSAR